MPRSPSRDLSDRFIGSRRYFRQLTPIERWKFGLSRAALVALAIWAVVSFAFPAVDSRLQVSHGPLADVHAAWDAQCDACHRPNAGLSLDAHVKWHDLTCQKCHGAPAHHASIPAGDAVETCSSCHHDHQGRTNSLVRLTDNHCVRCHANLASSTFAKKVTNFAEDHPPFRSLEKRPSTLKFSHGQHMTAGIVMTEGAKNPFTIDHIQDESWKMKNLKSQPRSLQAPLVQLDCKACHSLDTTPKADGKYFARIQFDTNCKACHTLSTPSVVKSNKQVVDPFLIPHGKTLEELLKSIEAEYSVKLQSEHKPLFNSPNPFDPKRKDDPAVKAYQDEVQQVTHKAIEFLKLTCNKCHEMTGNLTKPSAIPTVWMTHAKFDHTAHRATDCKNCHPNTIAKFVGNDPNYEREPVNILGIDSCRECHGPKRGESGGIRHACTDCHRFHGGDQPLHGRGNPIRFPNDPLTWQEFLRGGKK